MVLAGSQVQSIPCRLRSRKVGIGAVFLAQQTANVVGQDAQQIVALFARR